MAGVTTGQGIESASYLHASIFQLPGLHRSDVPLTACDFRINEPCSDFERERKMLAARVDDEDHHSNVGGLSLFDGHDIVARLLLLSVRLWKS